MNRGYTCPFRAKENKYLVGSSPPMVTQGADGEDNGIMRSRVNPRVTTWGREGWAGTPARIACGPGPRFTVCSCCAPGTFVPAVRLPLLHAPGEAPPAGTQPAPFHPSFSTATEKLLFLKNSSKLVRLVFLYIYDREPSGGLLLPDHPSQELGPHLR